MEYKFKVGDIVRIKTWGSGCDNNSVGEEVTILKLGIYYNDNVGYIITSPSKGSTNSCTDKYDGFVGEKSFELVKSGETTYEIY